MAIFLDVVCILLIIFTPLSYLPLFYGLYVLRSANGISITAALVLALCAQSQVATMYYLWACPPSKRYGEVVPKPPLSTDYLNLVQVLVQWICSLLFLTALVLLCSHAENDTEAGATTPTDSAEATTATINGPSDRTVVMFLVTHASLCVFWAIVAGTPSDDTFDLPFISIMTVQQIVIDPVVAIATGVAFALQVSATKKAEDPSALSRATLLLPAVVFMALAVSWPFRFRVPKNLWCSGSLWYVAEWYPQVGWVCINHAIIAVGYGVFLYVVARNTGSGGELGTEREAILGH